MPDSQRLNQSRKELYLKQYEESKKAGETFYPYTLVRDAIVSLLVVAVIIALAIWVPAKLEPMADPTSTTYNPRPEWYFLFFFQFLKLFPGSMEAIAAVVIPLLALSFLIILPFIDRNWERHWSKRKGVIFGGVVAVIVFVSLEVTGMLSAPSRPAGEEDLIVQTGRDVYRQINCSYCHSINGVGGNIGPELGNVGQNLTEDQIVTYLQNPHAMVPTTLHPKLLFTDEELKALVAYLSTLGAPIKYSENAPQLYSQYCASCHALNGQGGTLGPDLTGIGDRRPLSFLEAFTRDPSSVLAGTTMPAFKNRLSAEQINDIAAYLFSQKKGGGGPAIAPPSSPPPAAPHIPHKLDDRQNCLLCHGLGASVPFPADHSGRGNDSCLACHQPSED